MEFTQENLENFLVDKSFSLASKIKELAFPQKDEKGKYLDFDESLKLRHSKTTDMITKINNGHLLSSEPDWKKATVVLSLAIYLSEPGYHLEKVYKARDLAFSILVRSHKCPPDTEDVEYQTIVTKFLRYINISIQKEQEDIFYFYSNSEPYYDLWKLFVSVLESSLVKLKKKQKGKYLDKIKIAEDEIALFKLRDK